MIDRVAIFVDGAYLEWLIEASVGPGRARIHDLIAHMVGKAELLRVYWYDCLPAIRGPADAARLQSKEKFLHYLRGLPKVEVRLGKMGIVSQKDGDKSFVQKGVDVSLAVDLVALATQRAISQAHLVSGDNDFAPAVRYAKGNGVSVKLWYGTRSRPGMDLYDACDEREELRLADFRVEARAE